MKNAGVKGLTETLTKSEHVVSMKKYSIALTPIERGGGGVLQGREYEKCTRYSSPELKKYPPGLRAALNSRVFGWFG